MLRVEINCPQSHVADKDGSTFNNHVGYDLSQALIHYAGAGVGKSYVVKALRALAEAMGLNFQSIAPTGAAAAAIDGQTNHRFFGVPVKHGTNGQSFKKPAYREARANMETAGMKNRLAAINVCGFAP
jgi:hypothetical protein